MEIVLFTDFGSSDLYLGQVKAVLHRHAPSANVIDLLHEVPAFDVRAGAHLLDALKAAFPQGSVFLAVVDPGVGSDREALVVEADGRSYVGPDNGLLSVVAARAQARRFRRIAWRPASLSDSFHGRDLFAPVAAMVAQGSLPREFLQDTATLAVDFGAGDLAQILYVDHYGNCVTGIRAAAAPRHRRLLVRGLRLAYARVFAEAEPGTPFWYEDSMGLVEIALARGDAARVLGLTPGDRLEWEE